jgi:hypothetical protein
MRLGEHRLWTEMAVTHRSWLLQVSKCSMEGPKTRGIKMGTWVLVLSCSGDPTVCNTVLGPWKDARFGSEIRCMVQGDSIVKTAARTDNDNNMVITYSCRPYTSEDFKKTK